MASRHPDWWRREKSRRYDLKIRRDHQLITCGILTLLFCWFLHVFIGYTASVYGTLVFMLAANIIQWRYLREQYQPSSKDKDDPI
jgi:hypothetical protein